MNKIKIEKLSALIFGSIFLVSCFIFFNYYHIQSVAVVTCIIMLISGETASIQIGRILNRKRG